MKHLEIIGKLLKTLRKSSVFHALIVESEPGWAKSTTIHEALESLKIKYYPLESYSTALNLYHAFLENSDSTIVIDDAAGLWGDPVAMSILKAATWPSAGSGVKRKIAWGSTSERVQKRSFSFTGKVIVLTNTLSFGKETQAFLSRALTYRIEFSSDQIKEMLLEAAQSKRYYSNKKRALEVAKCLLDIASSEEPFRKVRINLRTLRMGYELAETHPKEWKFLLKSLLQSEAVATPVIIQDFLTNSESIKQQEAGFQAATVCPDGHSIIIEKRWG